MIFNERKLVLGMLEQKVKVKVKAKKFINSMISPELQMTCDIVSNIIYWTILNDIVQCYLELLNIVEYYQILSNIVQYCSILFK